MKTCLKNIITENFLNLVKEIDIPVQEVQSLKQDEATSRHNIIKMPKVLTMTILKSGREKQLSVKKLS